MRIKIICLLCLMLVQLLFCSCSQKEDVFNDVTQINSTQAEMSTEDLLGHSKDSNISVMLDSYVYDAEEDIVTVIIENNSSDVEYFYSHKVVLEVFDEETGEFVSFGEDKVYDDLAVGLLPNGESEMQFKLSEKFPEISALSENDDCRVGITFESDSGDIETVFVPINIK